MREVAHLVGHSKGGNVYGAVQLAKQHLASGAPGGCVVTVACDRGDRNFAPMRWEKKYVW